MATKPSSAVVRYDWSAPVDAAARPWAQIYDHFRFYARIVRNLPRGLKYRREIDTVAKGLPSLCAGSST